MKTNYPIAMNIKTSVSLGFENKLKNLRAIASEEFLIMKVLKDIKILKEFTAARTFSSVFTHKIPHFIIQLLLIQ